MRTGGTSRSKLVAARIADARRAMGLSRGELARLVDVDVTTVSGWEAGKYRPREGAHQKRLAAALGMELHDLHARPNDVKRAPSREPKLIDALGDFPALLETLLRSAKRSVKDLRLGAPYVLPPNIQVRFREAIAARIMDHSIEVQRVEIFYALERLKEVLANILRYHGRSYHVRSFCPGVEEVVPALGGYAFDDTKIILGGYFTAMPPHRKPGLLLQGPAVSQFFQAYWDEIWARGTPLNLSGASDLSAVRTLALRLGLPEARWGDFLADARALKIQDGAPPRI
jgi:transcriptional regulator with XRE-family HTH domain